MDKKQSAEMGGTALTEYLVNNDEGDVIGSLVHSRPTYAIQAEKYLA